MRNFISRARRISAAPLLLIFLLQPSCVTAGRRTSNAPLTEDHQRWVGKRVSDLRGIPFSAASMPAVDAEKRKELAIGLSRELMHSLSQQQVEARIRADQALGLVPREVNAVEAASRPMMVGDFGIAGTYDPKTKEIIVVKDLEGGPFSEFSLAHEYTHHLDNSKHNYFAAMLEARGNSDRGLAMQSLIEGSAMITQLDFALAENYEDSFSSIGALTVSRTLDDLESDFGLLGRAMRSGNAAAVEMLRKTPAYQRERIVFPYGRGLAFARLLKMRRGTAALDDAFAAPPVSTEQILHPEKFYDYREDPSEISINTEWLDKKAELVYEDTLGELGSRQTLRNYISDRAARDAAAGWGGDRYRILQIDGRDVLFWLTDWDSESDAREFARSVDLYYSNRYQSPGIWMSELGFDEIDRRDGLTIQIRRIGGAVAVVDGAPEGAGWAEKLLTSSKITKKETERRKSSLLEAIASPIVAVDHYKDGGGFDIFGGLLASEFHRKDSSSFSILGGTILDVRRDVDGGRLSFLFGLLSWRVAPREDLTKTRIGVSIYAKDRDSSSWSLIPIINAPAMSTAPGSSTFRTGILNLQNFYDVEFTNNAEAKSTTKIGGEISWLLGLTGSAWKDQIYSDGTPYRSRRFWGPFELGFSTVSGKRGPIAKDPNAPETRPAPGRLHPGDVEMFTTTQSFGELLFNYDSGSIVRDDRSIISVTNWAVLGGLIAAGGARGDGDWIVRTPLAGWAKLNGQHSLLFIWGMIAIPMGGSDANETSEEVK